MNIKLGSLLVITVTSLQLLENLLTNHGDTNTI